MQLTQKETLYLKDARSQEQLCANLYQQYSQMAQDPALKQILQSISGQEQQHLQTVQQLQQGQIPSTSSGSSTGGSQQSSGSGAGGNQQGGMTGRGNQNSGMMSSGSMMSSQGMQAGGQPFGQPFSDKEICEQLLNIEKSVSSMYDTAVFEFTNHPARQALDHIQQEEHHHGFQLWQYMNEQGWYQAQ